MRSTDPLTDAELHEVASEVGLSLQELRQALVARNRTQRDVVLGPHASMSEVAHDGAFGDHVEGRLPSPPEHAVAAVRHSIEQQTDCHGHRQGPRHADVVDDRHGLTYHIHGQRDGEGGALVHIDIDPGAGKGNQAMMATGVAGIGLTVMLLGWLFSTTVLMVGLGIGALGGLLVFRQSKGLAHAGKRAHTIAAQALVDAEGPANIGALPGA